MGCLFEIFIEIFIEGILNLVMFIYLKLAHMLVPNKQISKKTETKVRNIITIVSVLLVLSLLIGLIFLLTDDAAFNAIGKYMTFIPLSIIGLQVVLSIVVMIAKLVKRYKKWWGIFFVNTPQKILHESAGFLLFTSYLFTLTWNGRIFWEVIGKREEVRS